MSGRRPQENRKNPKNGSYPTSKGFFPHKVVQTELDPINKGLNPDWSITIKGFGL